MRRRDDARLGRDARREDARAARLEAALAGAVPRGEARRGKFVTLTNVSLELVLVVKYIRICVWAMCVPIASVNRTGTRTRTPGGPEPDRCVYPRNPDCGCRKTAP